jgi:formylglycine-generating enzyme required for sulfatase activity
VAGKSAVSLVILTCALAGCGAEAPAAKSPPTPGNSPSVPVAKPEAEGSGAASSECPDGMQAIPGGTLWTGSAKRELAPFCLDAREVTIADYLACVRNTICDAPPTEVQLLEPKRQAEHEARSRSCSARLDPSSELPVNCVAQADAVRYCSWKGSRLPTELEWEWAATGGDDRLDYAWGATPPRDDTVCWQSKRPCHVGSKPAEAFGLHDLGGNLSEWTSSQEATGPKLAVRGGNFADRDAEAVRSRRRETREPAFRDITLGFRCAKPL